MPLNSPKQTCTRSQTRRATAEVAVCASEKLDICCLPDELLLHTLSHLACSEAVPGGVEPGMATFAGGGDALVLGSSSRAARLWHKTHAISRRFRQLANAVEAWSQLRAMDDNGDLNWEVLRREPDDPGHSVWAASSTSRFNLELKSTSGSTRQ